MSLHFSLHFSFIKYFNIKYLYCKMNYQVEKYKLHIIFTINSKNIEKKIGHSPQLSIKLVNRHFLDVKWLA